MSAVLRVEIGREKELNHHRFRSLEMLVQSSNCQLPVLPTVAVEIIQLELGLKTVVLNN
jgi:hypothetical protein